MIKSERIFKAQEAQGSIVEGRVPQGTLNKYYIKYTFGNAEYDTVYSAFTKSIEFAAAQETNLEIFYNEYALTDTYLNEFKPATYQYDKLFGYFNSFINVNTLKYIDEIDAVYSLFILVDPVKATTDYSTLFIEKTILDSQIANFADYLYYSVYGRKNIYPELKVYEYFDVDAYLTTLL